MKRSDLLSNKYVVAPLLAALIGGAAGCSVATPSALIEARNSYQEAEKNPNMTGNAAVALRDAQQALTRGEREWEQNRDQEEVAHLAYLTKQRVAIAQSIAERNMAEKESEEFGDLRQKVIIEAREREVLRTRQDAEARAKEAEQARKTAALTKAEADAARQREQDAAAKNQELQQQLAELQANMKQTDRGLVLTLGDVLFEFDKAELKAGALRNLYPLVTFLKENPTRQVAIEGHTDNIGADSYNLELSQSRADAVRSLLVDNGIAPDGVTARGLGEAYPVASNNSDAGRQMNRRVEIVIANEKPSGS